MRQDGPGMTDEAVETELQSRGSIFTRGFDKLIPQAIAVRAVSIDIETDKQQYAVDETVEITVSIVNRLPVPVTVTIKSHRVWKWSIAGYTDGTAEPRYEPDTTRQFSLAAGETVTHQWTWPGRIRHPDASPTWQPLPHGEHRVSAELLTSPPQQASTTIVVQ